MIYDENNPHLSADGGSTAQHDSRDTHDLSMSSVKAGASVFGSTLFGGETSLDHSLCYSPSPLVERRKDLDNIQPPLGKILNFEKPSAAKKKYILSNRDSAVANECGDSGGSATEQNDDASRMSSAPSVRANPVGNRRPPSRETRTKDTAAMTGPSFSSGVSVNPVINNVRRSKVENVKEKQMSVAQLREQRRLEKEQALAFSEQAEQTRREVIELRKRLNERFRQSKIEREQKAQRQRLAEVEQELQFKSKVHVEHKRTLKQQADDRRRMSMADRARLRQNHREGKERMKLMAIQEDQALFDERHESSVAMRTAKAEQAERRRRSLAFRNQEGQRIRDLEHDMKTDEQHADHESYELKWAGERDAEEYLSEQAELRRQSLAFRNEEGRRIRDLQSDMKTEEQQTEHESYELKWAGEHDADDYRRQMAEERRNSLAFRNAEGRRIRELESDMKTGEQHAGHESYELKWAGERDADDYRRQMAEERRNSLAFRNEEGRRIRELESDMKTDEQHAGHESYELKWAGERDAEDYRRQMAEERRDSLAFRNAEGRRIRELESDMKTDEQHAGHESYELKWAGERDAEDYRRQMAEERRDSLAFRNEEGRRIRELESDMKTDEQQTEHESYELKWAGERDAEDYRRQMAEERREELSFRNNEASRRDAVMQELSILAQEREHESFILKWAGDDDAKEYISQQEELRRQSFAFRNAEGRRIREFDEEERAKAIEERSRDEELKAAGVSSMCFCLFEVVGLFLT